VTGGARWCTRRKAMGGPRSQVEKKRQGNNQWHVFAGLK
jgi:hypothetical protein